ncbi:MAG: transcriptional repressor NrdR [Clostridia bacterium]|nr:transcriptional repressor NrdR [Clostridia bacterium]
MKCPACGYTESKVLDSRPADGSIRRRRECLNCQRRFTTYERVEESPVMVVKKDGSRQLFDRNKIRDGIMHACQKRPVSYEEMEKLVKEVESAVQEAQVNEISSAQIGEMIMEGLKKIDEVAYVRFASVYRQFKDINTFMSELETLLKEQKKKGDF